MFPLNQHFEHISLLHYHSVLWNSCAGQIEADCSCVCLKYYHLSVVYCQIEQPSAFSVQVNSQFLWNGNLL
jgi:hypothetical protein